MSSAPLNALTQGRIPESFPDSLRSLPRDYRAFNGNLPCGFSDRLLSPAIRILRIGKSYVAELGACITKAGSKNFVQALTLEHNWVFDGSRIRPLPYDSPQRAAAILAVKGGVLCYPDVLRLLQYENDEIEIVVDPNVTQKANSRSRSLSLGRPVVGLQATLYPYQEHGVAWLMDALESMGGAILADEMGLGKTLQIIAVLLLRPPAQSHPALVVCPTTLITNWVREMIRFAPSLSVLVHRGADRTGYYRHLMRSDVVITTYDTLVNDLSAFRGVHWRYVICDEAQALKNPDAKRRAAVQALNRTYTVPVTGTPIENSLVDLWSLADIAIPGIFQSRATFEALYPNTEEAAHRLSVFSDSLVLKRRVQDVADDLPERTDVDFPLELDADGAEEYERILNETLEEYGRVGQLVAVGQLAIYCAHPWLRLRDLKLASIEDVEVEVCQDTRHPLMTPKMSVCIDLLKEAVSSGRKVLIFASYNACGELIKLAANERGLRIGYWDAINGATPQSERQSIVDRFTDALGSAVLVLNPKAAGAGLNITAATVVIHYTQSWNPALEMQASARAHRRGQELPVTIYRLFYQHTVEQTMVERSLWKRELGDTAMPIGVREKSDLNNALKLKPKGGQYGSFS